MHTWLSTVMALSSLPPARLAAAMPMGKAAATVMAKPMRTRVAVAGSFSATISCTGRL